MGPIALLLIGIAVWLMWTGRLQRMSSKDGLMLGVAIVGAIMAARGKPIIGALPLLVSAGYAAIRVRGKASAAKSGTATARSGDEAVADAAALLGLPRDADADSIRAAHRRLIASVHPDRGGTEALAAKINAARDLLLRHHEDTAGSRHGVTNPED